MELNLRPTVAYLVHDVGVPRPRVGRVLAAFPQAAIIL